MKTHPSEIVLSQFEDLAWFFDEWEGSIEQMTYGRFNGAIRIANGQVMRARYVEADQAVFVQGTEENGQYSICPVLPETTNCLWQGRPVAAGKIVVRAGNVAVDHRTSRRFGNLCARVNTDELIRTAGVLVRESDPPPEWAVISLAPDRFDRVVSLMRALVDAGSASDSSDGDAAHRTEMACLAAIVEAMYPRDEAAVRLRSLPARGALVRRADDFLRARVRDPISELDLCKELGVSGRTLRLAFRERFGLGPISYFQSLRLHAVRAALKTTDSTGRGIAAVAKEFGFGHPGKFAGYYRRQFGEPPSTTARYRGAPIATVSTPPASLPFDQT